MDQSTVEEVGDHLTPFRIAVVYAATGGAWIALSDRVLVLLVADRALTLEGVRTGRRPAARRHEREIL